MENNSILSILNKVSIIVAILGVLYIGVKFERGKNKVNDSKSAAIASSIGVLGTFIGISLGLYEFNPNDIASSIPILLEGMKVAFLTSIFGMIASLYIKGRQKYIMSNEEDENIDDIAELFNSMNNQMKNLNKTLVSNQNQTEDIFKHLGEMLYSNQKDLNDEIKLLNTSLNKKQDILISEFKAFGNKMAQNNTDALIDALNDVIKDFNNKISEQFGDNFKQLNDAVFELVGWQDNYKDIIEFNTQQLNKTVTTMSSAEKSLKEISTSSQVVIDMADKISGTFKHIDQSNKEIVDGLSIMDEISAKALQSIPDLNNYYKRYMEDFNSIINKLSSCIPSITEDLNGSYKVFNESLDVFKDKIDAALDVTSNQVKAQYETIEKTNKNLGIQLEDVTLKVSENIKNLVEQEEKVLQAKVNQLDELLEKELTQSLNTFATQLATISERFAKDYIPLADKLRDVVNIAKGA